MIVIATDTTSYPNMILETMSNDGTTIQRYELSPVEGYVLHNHETCYAGDEEIGIPSECCYFRRAYLPRNMNLSLINEMYEAVLESSVPADSIYGGGNDHEVM